MADKKELIAEWLKKAQHDIGTAELLLAQKQEYTDTICYHCQQAVEKYLKAYLVNLNIPFKKVHDLDYLLNLITEKETILTNSFLFHIFLLRYNIYSIL